MKNTAVLYIHGKGGKGGNAAEAEHYRSLFPDAEVIGFDYKAETPWDAAPEFAAFVAGLGHEHIVLIANSVGAYFSMNSGIAERIERAFLISPIVSMEKLIESMMTWANVTERQLEAEKTIETAFGETLSWDYLSYVRAHPIAWDVPTEILYGETDNLQSLDTVRSFAETHNAGLTVMPGGEHWFHTPEQMKFLDNWMQKLL